MLPSARIILGIEDQNSVSTLFSREENVIRRKGNENDVTYEPEESLELQ